VPDFDYAKGRTVETINFILEEIKEFELEYEVKTWKEYQNDKKLQKLIDRTVENILTAFIELCGTIITSKGVAAENYADAIRKCAELFGLTEIEQNNLSKLAIQRNRLAHRYLDFRWQAARMFAEYKGLVLSLIRKILEHEE
jgi:uncharacterized protein YutE (UPF0331/DUF86 family)